MAMFWIRFFPLSCQNFFIPEFGSWLYKTPKKKNFFWEKRYKTRKKVNKMFYFMACTLNTVFFGHNYQNPYQTPLLDLKIYN